MRNGNGLDANEPRPRRSRSAMPVCAAVLSFNFRDRFIRHRNFGGVLSRKKTGGPRLTSLPRSSTQVLAEYRCDPRISRIGFCGTVTFGSCWRSQPGPRSAVQAGLNVLSRGRARSLQRGFLPLMKLPGPLSLSTELPSVPWPKGQPESCRRCNIFPGTAHRSRPRPQPCRRLAQRTCTTSTAGSRSPFTTHRRIFTAHQ
jgi:hypothetical protein